MPASASCRSSATPDPQLSVGIGRCDAISTDRESGSIRTRSPACCDGRRSSRPTRPTRPNPTASTRRRSSKRLTRQGSRSSPCVERLAIERLGPPPAGQVGDVVLGPPVVVVDAEVPGHADRCAGRVSTPGWSPGITCGGNGAVIAERSSPAARASSAARCAPCARRPVRDSSGGCTASLPAPKTPAPAHASCASRPIGPPSVARWPAKARPSPPLARSGCSSAGLLAGPVVLVVAPVVALAGVGCRGQGSRPRRSGRARGRTRPRRRRAGE